MFSRERKRVFTGLQSFWWPLTSAQVPWLWSYVTSLLNIVLITSPPCEGNAAKKTLLSELRRWNILAGAAAFVLHSPLMVERTPQCPRCHLHEPRCLSWACKRSSLDESHSLGRLSDLWRHTFRVIEQTDPISHFVSWRQFESEASDYPWISSSLSAEAERRKKRWRTSITKLDTDNLRNSLRFEIISHVEERDLRTLWKLLSSVQVTCLMMDEHSTISLDINVFPSIMLFICLQLITNEKHFLST